MKNEVKKNMEMNNTFNIIIDDDAWKNCDFEVYQIAKNVFDAVFCYVAEREEVDFLSSEQNIVVNLSLSNDTEIHKLNKEFRNIDKPTNVLSFANIDDEDFNNYAKTSSEIELGDIIIAFETLSREAAEKKISLHNHFAHLLIHGLLHLLGFDHQQDDEAEYMENFEINILKQLNIDNPYQEYN